MYICTYFYPQSKIISALHYEKMNYFGPNLCARVTHGIIVKCNHLIIVHSDKPCEPTSKRHSSSIGLHWDIGCFTHLPYCSWSLSSCLRFLCLSWQSKTWRAVAWTLRRRSGTPSRSRFAHLLWIVPGPQRKRTFVCTLLFPDVMIVACRFGWLFMTHCVGTSGLEKSP